MSVFWLGFDQNMVFDTESKSVLHTEMAKKNLFVKRGERNWMSVISLSCLVVFCFACFGSVESLWHWGCLCCGGVC